MQAIVNRSVQPSSRAQTGTYWASRIVEGILVLFLLVDGAGKVLRLAPYVEGTAKLGFPPETLVPLGLVLLACTALYVVRPTAILGAVLLTGYFGGAVATMVHTGQSFAFPVIFGMFTWLVLFTRDARLRRIVRIALNRE